VNRFARALAGALVPKAERDELVEALAEEYAGRVSTHGRLAAMMWLWRQVVGSAPPLVGRLWWRGWTGFDSNANRLEGGGHPLETWITDLRYSVRRLMNRPAYALLAVLTLALGAGGTAAIFSIVRALLIEPLPVAHEEQIGVFWFGGSWTQQEFLHFRPNFPGFQQVAAYMPGDQTLEQAGAPMRLVRGVSTSAELFDILGVHALVGRTFQSGDDLIGAAPVAVLSYGLWQELGADPGIVGRQLRLGGEPRTVVGVMPRGFWFPNPQTRVWTSTPLDPQNRVGNWTLVGRVSDGMAVAHMDAPLAAIVRELAANFRYPAQWDKTRAPQITPLREHVVGTVRTALLATLSAMGLILLIACVDVATLMLGQISGRSSELAIRAALGAGRQRLVQQVVLESLVIGVVAGAAGAAFAALSFDVVLRSLSLGALAESATLDWRVFLGSGAFALVAASAVAMIPSIALWRGNLAASIASERTGGTPGRGGRLESSLVVAQIAIALLLTAGAGLLLRSVTNLRAINIGIRADRVAVIDTTMPVQLSQPERHRAVADVVEALRSLPNVRGAAAAERIPLRGSSDNWGMDIPGKPQFKDSVTAVRIVTDDYFNVMGIAVHRGRGFVPNDRMSAARLVVINEALAAKYFPDEDPVGRTLQTFDQAGERIIGVVANVAENTLTEPSVPARYMLYEHDPIMWPAATFVLSGATADDVPRLLAAARTAIETRGRQLAVERTQSMASVLDDAIGAPGRLAALVSLLAGLALLLGAVGVYGMISHFVTRRSREYGIRLALGLPPTRVVSHVLGRGLRLIGLGSAIGIATAVVLTRLVASLLYGVTATDPQALAAAVLVLVVAGALAALIPARRASRTDPARVLRQV
jgi:predicted permease